MSEEGLLSAAEPAAETPTDMASDVAAEAHEHQGDTAPQETAEQPAEQSPEHQGVFDQMVPLFKELNVEAETAREVVDRLISGGDIGDLVDDNGRIFGKYTDSIAAQEAFKKLESENGRLRREKSPEAPESYVYDFSGDEDLSSIIPEDYKFEDDPLIQHMEPVFKEGNFTQDQVNLATKAWLQYQAASRTDPKAELEKLGDNADNVIRAAQEFMSNKAFNESEQAIIESWGTTAEEVQLLNKIKKMATPNSTIPSKASSGPIKSSAELYSEAKELRNKPNFSNDTNAQRLYEEKMDKAIAAEEKGH
jgi:hypothetical protein